MTKFCIIILLIGILSLLPSSEGQKAGDRTLICLTGALRSSNFTWASGWLSPRLNYQPLPTDGPPTPAQNLIERVFRPLAKEGAIDVFMYIPADPKDRDYVWDGKPENYKPKVGDIEGLKEEGVHMTNFFSKDERWETYFFAHAPEFHERFLGQLVGNYECNVAAIQYAMSNKVTYKYKMRLRPDLALHSSFPDLDTLNYGPQGDKCGHTIYFADGDDLGDKLMFGPSEQMDYVFNRWTDFIIKPDHLMHISRWPKYPELWDSEGNLAEVLRIRYNTCSTVYRGGLNQVTVRFHIPDAPAPPASTSLPKKPDDWFQMTGGSKVTAEMIRLGELKKLLNGRAFRQKGAREIFALDGDVKRSIPNWDTFLKMNLPESIVDLPPADFETIKTGDPWPALS